MAELLWVLGALVVGLGGGFVAGRRRTTVAPAEARAADARDRLGDVLQESGAVTPG